MKSKENYLERIPSRSADITWSTDENRLVILDVENKGIVNRLFQKFLKKPKVSHIHLDEFGSFIWPILDGEKSILDIGIIVDEHFGEKAKPLYERLAKYFQILDNYKFVKWIDKEK